MKIVPPPWPPRRKLPKIGHVLEAGIWAAAGGLALTLVLTGTSPVGVLAAPASLAAPLPELTAGSMRLACLKRVIDLSHGRSEAYIVAELNRRCFAPRRLQTPAAPPRVTCANAFTWGPGVTPDPSSRPCFRQSTAGSRPRSSRLAEVPSLSTLWPGSRPTPG